MPPMTTYYMIRSFDHAGYYETRLLMMLMAFAVAFYFQVRYRDSRYLVILASGVICQAFMEWVLQALGLRGAGYNFSVFGVTMSGWVANAFQGLAEGGIFSLMAFWFVALRTDRDEVSSLKLFVFVYVAIVILACAVGVMANGQPVTSTRQMFSRTTLIYTPATAIPSILIAWWRRGLRELWLYYFGLVIYCYLVFTPLQVFGTRYIGVKNATGQVVAAGFVTQAAVMSASYWTEVAGGKIYYFAIPLAFGWLKKRKS
jgi:hypothetical protein